MMSNAHAISAVMYKSLRYDPVNDFQMVSMVATAGLVLVAAPAFPASDLAGVLAAVRASPGKFNFGSAGVGTTQHFAGELMKQTAGLNITHVPYRSTPAAVTGLRAGEVEFVFELVQTVQGQIQMGELKAIAVTSPKRNPMLADVPTFTEADMPGYDVTTKVDLLSLQRSALGAHVPHNRSGTLRWRTLSASAAPDRSTEAKAMMMRMVLSAR
jgi:tripartite-type tricarboxylate transporter receptor subunit TctC